MLHVAAFVPVARSAGSPTRLSSTHHPPGCRPSTPSLAGGRRRPLYTCEHSICCTRAQFHRVVCTLAAVVRRHPQIAATRRNPRGSFSCLQTASAILALPRHNGQSFQVRFPIAGSTRAIVALRVTSDDLVLSDLYRTLTIRRAFRRRHHEYARRTRPDAACITDRHVYSEKTEA